MPRTKLNEMGGYELVIPNLMLVQIFNEIVLPIINKLRSNIFESITLAEIRDTLLPKLVSGELRVQLLKKLWRMSYEYTT